MLSVYRSQHLHICSVEMCFNWLTLHCINARSSRLSHFDIDIKPNYVLLIRFILQVELYNTDKNQLLKGETQKI